jgi:hypothetical protein
MIEVTTEGKNNVLLNYWHRGRPEVQRTNKILTADPFNNTYEANEISPDVEVGVVERL